jgi:hypothetical protein
MHAVEPCCLEHQAAEFHQRRQAIEREGGLDETAIILTDEVYQIVAFQVQIGSIKARLGKIFH